MINLLKFTLGNGKQGNVLVEQKAGATRFYAKLDNKTVKIDVMNNAILNDKKGDSFLNISANNVKELLGVTWKSNKRPALKLTNFADGTRIPTGKMVSISDIACNLTMQNKEISKELVLKAILEQPTSYKVTKTQTPSREGVSYQTAYEMGGMDFAEQG